VNEEGLFTPNRSGRDQDKTSLNRVLVKEKPVPGVAEHHLRVGPSNSQRQIEGQTGGKEQGNNMIDFSDKPSRVNIAEKGSTVKNPRVTKKGNHSSTVRSGPDVLDEKYILVEYRGDERVFDHTFVSDFPGLLQSSSSSPAASWDLGKGDERPPGKSVKEALSDFPFPVGDIELDSFDDSNHVECESHCPPSYTQQNQHKPTTCGLPLSVGVTLENQNQHKSTSCGLPLSAGATLENMHKSTACELPLSSLYFHQPEYFGDTQGVTLEKQQLFSMKKNKEKQNRRVKRSQQNSTQNTSEQVENERVEGIIPFRSEAYTAGRTVSSVFLYEVEDNQRGLFQTKSIQLDSNARCTAIARAVSGRPELKTLFDTGATHVMVSNSFFQNNENHEKSRFLMMTPVLVKLGDGRYLKVTECATIVVEIQGMVFQFVAWITPLGKGTDLIIGIHAMHELEGKLDLVRFRFDFKDRSQPIQPLKEIKVQKGKPTPVHLSIGAIPDDFPVSGEVICYMRDNGREAYKPVALDFEGKTVSAQFANYKNIEVLSNKEPQGFIDFRSIGYLFLSEEELKDRTSKIYVYFEASEGEKVRPKTPRVKGKKIPSAQDKHPDKITTIKTVKTESPAKPGKRFVNGFWVEEDDPYPWLEKDDPRRNKTNSEILREVIDLSDSMLTNEEKEQVLQLCEKYHQAFSLRDEIGECDYLEVDLELKDTEPFFNRPYPIKEAEKEIIDKEMKRGCLLGILKKGLTSYSSPIMLITRKQGGVKRIVSDFRFLNSRLRLLQCSMPLIKDAIQTLGAVQAEVASIIDLRDAFHTLKLSERSQMYVGITPYMGSPTYIYQRLPMGLSVSPSVFMYFITKVMDQLEDKRVFLAIMDDILVNSKKNEHMAHLESLFKILIKNGLKISPKKVQLFKQEVTYMGTKLSYKRGHPTLQPTTSKIDAINKITHLETITDVRGFCGMVNFLAPFIKDLQRLLIPIYNLQRKNVPFEWTDECQSAFDEIKKRLTSAPVLSMPTLDGKFTLVSDTSKTGTGAALYQEQDVVEGKSESENHNKELRLIAYNSKRLADAASRYSISELELHGLVINIKAFDHVLRGSEFEAVVDHSALVFILRGKKEPPTLRLKKMLEQLSQYHFTTKFLKGQEMFISDFLSRHTGNEKYSEEVLPIAVFDEVPNVNTYGPEELQALISNSVKHDLNVATRSRAKPDDVLDKDALDQVLKRNRTKPKQTENVPARPDPMTLIKKCTVNLGPRVEVPKPTKSIPETTLDDAPKVPEIPTDLRPHIPQEVFDILDEGERQSRQSSPPTPLPAHLFRPPPNLSTRLRQENIPIQIRHDQGEKLFPHKRSLEYRLQGEAPRHDDPTDYRPPPEMLYRDTAPLFTDDLNPKDIIYKHVPKARELTKNLESLRLKVINDYKVPFEVKDLVQEIRNDPYFKPIYDYLRTGRVSENDTKTRNLAGIKAEAQDFILIEKVLFRIEFNKLTGDYFLQLCVPQKYLPTLLYHYHDTLLAGHQGVIRMYLTLRNKFYAPYLCQNIRTYLSACYTCQVRAAPPEMQKAHFLRIPLDFRPMQSISMDVKKMPRAGTGEAHLLVICCEISNYVIGVPLKSECSTAIIEALLHKVIFTFGPPRRIVTDQGSPLTSALVQEIYEALQIDCKLVSPENHGSLRVERYIQTVSKMIEKQLTNKGPSWPIFVGPCCYAHNTFVTPTLGVSPFQLVFLREPPDLSNVRFDPIVTKSLDAKEYLAVIQKRFKTLQETIITKKLLNQQKQLARQEKLHLDKHHYAKGDLVYYFAPRLSELITTSRKFKASYIGPLQIAQILDETHYLVADLEGRILKLLGGVHVNMLKPYVAQFGEMKNNRLVTYTNISELPMPKFPKPVI